MAVLHENLKNIKTQSKIFDQVIKRLERRFEVRLGLSVSPVPSKVEEKSPKIFLIS